ncbi:MAG: 23S rRNA (pseudouridine(1915)-N(3))-methyltransferase RlmH [Deltaproteobacteria bacterium]|nr:23S rRNA (pseudouridine(1915)-N(3))-methyltransferase RlmH [Deltaproteobacteria bacterium]
MAGLWERERLAVLRIRVIVVDRTRLPFLRDGESFYTRRVRRYATLEWTEVRPAKMSRGRPEREVLGEEGSNILKRVSPEDFLVALDRSGRLLDSERLAGWLAELSGRGMEWLTFVIGGPLGLSGEVLSRARETLALSRFTFTHEMSRLVLLEQLYRAYTILRGERYHK